MRLKIVEMVQMWFGGLRNQFRVISGSFFGPAPAFDKTRIDYDLARQLYRNDGGDTMLGAGFCKPIIDRTVEFMGIPFVNSDDEALDTRVNTAIERYWTPKLQEMFRNALRDSVTYARVYQPLLDNPLITREEQQACKIMLYEPERVTITYDPRNPEMIMQAVIVTKVAFPDEVEPNVDAPRGSKPKVKEHEIWEIITPDAYRYYDRTMHEWLTDWARPNPAGFVPMAEIWNEWDSALTGGQSDLESCFPFVKAFHEVLRQTLQSHKYHSMPKLKFKVSDIISFLSSNFPSTIGENGLPIPGAAIPWQGKEVLFIGEDEDIDFIQINSILGESKLLLEFLIDCISVASETPEWAFMRNVEGGSGQSAVNAQTIPFEKKIERKRGMFQPFIQQLVKMMLVLDGEEPTTVTVLWQEVRPEALATLTQSMEQLVMTLEVLLERKLISENTAREALRIFRVFKTMKSSAEEAEDAQDNLSLEERSAELDAKSQIEVARNVPRELTSGQNGGGNRVPAVSGRNGGGNNE